MTYAYDRHVQSSTIENAFILAPYDANYCRSGQPYADPTPCIIVRREGYPTLLGREDSEGASHVFIVSESDLERARITGAMGNP